MSQTRSSKRDQPGYVNPLRGRKLSPETVANIRAARMAVIPPLEVRFWSKVDKEGPVHPTLGQCWVWAASMDRWGRGRFGFEGRNEYAYRVAMRLSGQEIPTDLPKHRVTVDHLCKNVACVRPDHLRLATSHQNYVENSDSPFGKNARKTHCKHGHPFSAENTIWHQVPRDKKPSRVCATCRPWVRNSRYRVDPPEQFQP